MGQSNVVISGESNENLIDRRVVCMKDGGYIEDLTSGQQCTQLQLDRQDSHVAIQPYLFLHRHDVDIFSNFHRQAPVSVFALVYEQVAARLPTSPSVVHGTSHCMIHAQWDDRQAGKRRGGNS